jgi:hypothetical protein
MKSETDVLVGYHRANMNKTKLRMGRDWETHNDLLSETFRRIVVTE